MTPIPLSFDNALFDDWEFERLLSQPYTSNQASNASTSIKREEVATNHNPFFDSLRNPTLQLHDKPLNSTELTSNLMLTDNSGTTHISTLSPTLDLFVELTSNSNSTNLSTLLTKSWEENSLETLKIIYNARSIPRGKSEKEAWTRGVAWLAEFHPQTFLRNLIEVVRPSDKIIRKRKSDEIGEGIEGASEVLLVEEGEEEFEFNPATARSHGNYKDLLNLLVLSSLPTDNTSTKNQLSVNGDYTLLPGFTVDEESSFSNKRSKQKKGVPGLVTGTGSKAEKKQAQYDHLERLLSSTTTLNYRVLHLLVARIFAHQLKEDLNNLTLSQELKLAGREKESEQISSRISLAAKWAPSEDGFHNKYTQITSSIAEILTPLSKNRTSASLVYSISIYRSKYLVPLRAHLDLVEIKMSSNKWESIDYSRVPSIAMDKNKRHFVKHNRTGFTEYLTKVVKGGANISGVALTPGGLVKQIWGHQHGEDDDLLDLVIDGQWKSLVDSIKDTGALSNCIAVADVSGSMLSPQLHDKTSPIHSSVALSILISQVTQPPFANSIISFTDQPAFIDLTSDTLRGKVQQIQSQGVGYSTNFIAVFRTILSRAQQFKITNEQMVKRIFIFSDMEFDQCQPSYSNQYSTHFDIVEEEFRVAGYDLPELVFWNLAARNDGKSKPITGERKGACLVSGYSAAMVKVFLDGAEFDNVTEEVVEEQKDDEWEELAETDDSGVEVKKATRMDPLAMMRKAIGHESFDGLKVYD